MATSTIGPRPRQDHDRPGDHSRAGRGLRRRHRRTARPAQRVRPRGLRPDRVPRHRPTRRGRRGSAHRDPPGAGDHPRLGLDTRRNTPAGRKITIDLDATLVIAHSEKQDAAKTWKKTFGFHPLLGFCDHGEDGTGEPVAGLLRRGNAGSNTASDHVTVLDAALTQIPTHLRKPDEQGRMM